MSKILIVEDEKKLRDVMKLYLNKEGYEIICAKDGFEGNELIENETFNLIILDVMIPKKDGWSLLRKSKSLNSKVPVIMITARGDEEDRIFGLELGADDYMVKPISMRELVLRVKLRINTIKENKCENFKIDNLIVDVEKHLVKEFGSIITLTPKEFDLMTFLIRNMNIVFNREKLLEKVWGYDFIGDSRTIDTHVKNLREKIKYFNENLKTVWGVGYKLEDRNE